MLKGKATIQLFDGKTGALVDERHEENLITNAIQTILNPPDYIELGMGLASEDNRAYNMLHIFNGDLANTAFGGVLVFRDKIPEDPDQMMMPWDNEEIGHAGMATTNSAATIGTYNANESGVIENGRGYRQVWDFGTDKANGDISCICLTTKDGGTNGYHNVFPNLSMGGIDIASSETSTWKPTARAFVLRRQSNDIFPAWKYTFFYMGRHENGNVRLLAKDITDGGIYELQIYNPTAISINHDKPFCNFVSIKKVIEIYPAPKEIEGTQGTRYKYYWNKYIDHNTSSASSLTEGERKQLTDAWEENPGWMCYVPYVVGDEIHVVGTTPKHIHHIIYDLNTYKEKSRKKIAAEVDLQPFNVTFRNERTADNSTYRWVYGKIQATDDSGGDSTYSADEMAVGAIYLDGKYFAVTQHPYFNAQRQTTQNYHQLEGFTEDGTSTEERIQYFANQNLSTLTYAWHGYYYDEKSKTPILITVNSSVWATNRALKSCIVRKTKNGYELYSSSSSTSESNQSGTGGHATFIKTQDMPLPLYVTQTYTLNSGGQTNFGLGIGVIKNCLVSINNLSQPVRKLEGQVMKITYDITEEAEEE